MRSTLDRVSKLERTEESLAESYERGEIVDIAQVMLASQRSAIAFEATLQVRNKMLSAYREVMNMQL